ncbi:MAG: serine acetyltransferase [Bacilli bacterium]|nr:serine acetyltransferase [Bacilli bacterium]
MSWKCAAKRIINWTNRKFYGLVCLQDNAGEDENDFPAFFDETMNELKVDYDFAGFERDLVTVKEMLDEDVEAAYNGDPAAKSKEEIITAYPGFYAILVHRIAHVLYKKSVPILPRMMSELAHSSTGIDIHPGATIGHYFFIDHGTGVVIGETTVVGNNVRIYQGVTLGAKSLEHADELRNKKRHPTIKDNVIIYSGASILGGDTVIGSNVTIGSNVFITFSVEDNKIVRFESKNYSIIDKK